ncbi:hypothetical protein ACFV4E_22545 [Streptomyces hygroscopicus]|uniref:hypothetical protein n=1 Tax=Streptomyces hygroscopicus TaxID=1912 RepID=UPI001F20ECEA|nr:hypothetical protein [Streptomyces hygroscopicus]
MSPRQKTGRRDLRAAGKTAQQAVRHLNEQGEEDMANAVQAILDYAATPAWHSSGVTTLSLLVPIAFRDRVQELADTEGVKLSSAATGELNNFLLGGWEPTQPRRRTASGDMVTMNITVPETLLAEVEQAAKRYASEQGWTLSPQMALNARKLTIQALERRFGVVQEVEGRGWDADDRLLMDVPEEFRDRVQAAARHDRAELSRTLRDAYARFLSGEWTPPKPKYAPRGHGMSKVRMVIQVNSAVRDQVKAAGADPKRVKARGGYKLSPRQVALAALMDAYDVPENLLYPWAG